MKVLSRSTGLAALLTVPIVAWPIAVAHAADPSPTVVSITFDDTYADTIPALDAMSARDIKGTLYVNSQRVGFNGNYMTRNQLKAYSQNGFEIGGHTLNHEELPLLAPDVAKANICSDRSNLMDLGYRVTSFAYPFGANTPEIQQMVKDCGYNSARITSDLRAPTSCLKCDANESIPAENPYEIRTPSTVRSTWSLTDMQNIVLAAGSEGGGWVPFVFHRIGDGGGNSIPMEQFTAFLDWLPTQANVTIKTVDQVIGGDVKPAPDGDDPVPEPDLVVIGTKNHSIDGVNAQRITNSMILYTRVRGTATGANQYGTEVTIVNGVVTKVESNVGNAAIPTGGVVLSGHGTSATWLKANAKVGTAVTIHGLDDAPLPPPPPSVEYPKTKVAIGAANHAVLGVDVYRSANSLVVYTDDTGPSTGTNEFGFEAVVIDGKVTKVENGVGNIAIPANGYVLSGHGESRTWLKANAVVGATVAP